MRPFKLLILLVCMAFSANALADLRTYEVDPRNGEEMFRALASILASPNGNVRGSISRLPTGQILIDTTPEMHQQIADVLEAVNTYKAEPTPRVTLQYWAVLGSRGAAGDAETPAILRNVLDEITQVHGPLSFRLLGNASLVSDSGRTGSSEGEMTVRQTAYVQDDTLNADLNIALRVNYQATVEYVQEDGSPAQRVVRTFENTGITINMSMQRGEFVVVGENTVSNDFVEKLGIDGTIFYIVHWPAAN
jgi:hypothetical protein